MSKKVIGATVGTNMNPKKLPAGCLVQNTQPVGADIGALWFNPDEELPSSGGGAGGTSASESECRSAFMDEMESYATRIGANSSTWGDPTGFTNRSTAKDVCKILVHASGYARLYDIWNTPTHVIKRIQADGTIVSSSVSSSALGDPASKALTSAYNVMGVKTGTLFDSMTHDGDYYNLASIVQSKKKPDDWYAIVVIKAASENGGANDRFAVTKAVMDAIESTIEDDNDAPAIDPLDEIAWDDLTWRDIFITNNYAPTINQGTKDSIVGPYVDFAGTTTIVEDNTSAENYVPPYYLNIVGTSSQQARDDDGDGNYLDVKNRTWYAACNVNVTRYVKGRFGLITTQEATAYAAVERATNGWEVCTATWQEGAGIATARTPLTIGSAFSANVDGRINNPVFVEATIFETAPTADEWRNLYLAYNDLLCRNSAAGRSVSNRADTANASHIYAVKIPHHNPRAFQHIDLPSAYSKAWTSSIWPASISKILVAMLTLDYVPNLYEKITVSQGDKDALLKDGEWYSDDLNVGDTLTYMDLLYAAMLPSSNIAPHVLCRGVGEKILRSKTL